MNKMDYINPQNSREMWLPVCASVGASAVVGILRTDDWSLWPVTGICGQFADVRFVARLLSYCNLKLK